jgi:hypothetical protein
MTDYLDRETREGLAFMRGLDPRFGAVADTLVALKLGEGAMEFGVGR